MSNELCVSGTVTSTCFSVPSVVRFVDPFELDLGEPEQPPVSATSPEAKPVVATPPAPVIPKPATNGHLRFKPVIRKPVFGPEDIRRIMAAEARKRSATATLEEACIAACGFGLRLVMFDYHAAPNYADLLEQVRFAAIEAHNGNALAAGAWYHDAKKEFKKEREVKKAKPAFVPAVIVAPAPVVELEPMVEPHLLFRQLMVAAPADIESVARRVVGTLKGDDRYAGCESARQQLLVDTKAKVIAVLIANGVSPEEALRRGEAVKNAWPLLPKKKVAKRTAPTASAKPLTAEELRELFGKDEAVETTPKSSKPAKSNGHVRSPEEIAAHHERVAMDLKWKASGKRAQEKAEAEAREAKTAKAAAEAQEAERRAADKARKETEAAEKRDAKKKGKHGQR